MIVIDNLGSIGEPNELPFDGEINSEYNSKMNALRDHISDLKSDPYNEKRREPVVNKILDLYKFNCLAIYTLSKSALKAELFKDVRKEIFDAGYSKEQIFSVCNTSIERVIVSQALEY